MAHDSNFIFKIVFFSDVCVFCIKCILNFNFIPNKDFRKYLKKKSVTQLNSLSFFYSIKPYNIDLSGHRRASDSSINSDDSNDENNYRNDYPSTEEDEKDYDDESVNEDDMRKAFKTMDIGILNERKLQFFMDKLILFIFIDKEGDLSTDDDDETAYKNGFVYSIDSQAIGFEDDIDYCDVNRYGEAYARYKARVVSKKDDESENELDYEDPQSGLSDDEYHSQ